MARNASASVYSGSAGACFVYAVAVRVLGVFFLNASRVGQHDAAKILRAGRTEDSAPEALRYEARQIAAVIEVRVGQDDRGDVGRTNRQVMPVALAQFLEALKQPAVDEYLGGSSVEQMLRAGHRSRGARGIAASSDSFSLREETDLATGVPEENCCGIAESAGTHARNQAGHRLGRVRLDRRRWPRCGRPGRWLRVTPASARHSRRRRSDRRRRSRLRRSAQGRDVGRSDELRQSRQQAPDRRCQRRRRLISADAEHSACVHPPARTRRPVPPAFRRTTSNGR